MSRKSWGVLAIAGIFILVLCALGAMMTLSLGQSSVESPPPTVGSSGAISSPRPTQISGVAGTSLPTRAALPTPEPGGEMGEEPDTTLPADPALVANLVTQAVDHLAEGQIAFDPPTQMIVGETETLHVRIIQQTGESAEELIIEGLEAENRSVERQTVTVSTEMEVMLEALEEEFKITPLGPARRVVGQSNFTEWAWLVTPQQGGPHSLYLSVSAIVEIPGLAQKTVTLPVLERTIEVKVTFAQRLSSFVGNYWEFLLTVLIIPALGGAWRWYKGRR